jgi:hypothetical protein
VEAVVREHPVVRQPPAVDALARPGPQRLRCRAERLLGDLELLELGFGELRRGDLGCQ